MINPFLINDAFIKIKDNKSNLIHIFSILIDNYTIS